MFNLFKKKIQKYNSPQSRKKRSENRLTELGISYNPNLPLTNEKYSVEIRNVKEVSSKIICLWEVVNIANNVKDSNRSESIDFLKGLGLWDSLSLFNHEFLTNENQTKQRIIDIIWRTEVLKVLYWSLKKFNL